MGSKIDPLHKVVFFESEYLHLNCFECIFSRLCQKMSLFFPNPRFRSMVRLNGLIDVNCMKIILFYLYIKVHLFFKVFAQSLFYESKVFSPNLFWHQLKDHVFKMKNTFKKWMHYTGSSDSKQNNVNSIYRVFELIFHMVFWWRRLSRSLGSQMLLRSLRLFRFLKPGKSSSIWFFGVKEAVEVIEASDVIMSVEVIEATEVSRTSLGTWN